MKRQNHAAGRWATLTFAIGSLALFANAAAPAQEMRDLLEQALDQNVKHIAITERPLTAALQELETQTGVRFKLDDRVLDLMPYGPRTTVSLQLENTPLRAGLHQMFDRLGLAMRVADSQIVVEPAPVLSRLGRRVTVNELGLIEKLASGPWVTVRDKLSLQFRIDPALKPAESLAQAIAQNAAGAAIKQLDAAVAALGWVWFPQDEQIVICPRIDYVRNRLDQPVDLSYQRLALEEVLLDLGRKSGVNVAFEPAALSCTSARNRTVDLIQRRTTVRQALELLCGRTGLKFDVVDDGIRVASLKADSARAPMGGMVVRVSVPLGTTGAMVDFLVPEDQLPPELQSLRQEKIEELLRLLKQQRTAGGGAP